MLRRVNNLAKRTSVSDKKIFRRYAPIPALFDALRTNCKPICELKNILRHTLHDKRGRTGMLSQLVDWQDTVADEIRASRRELRKDQTRAIT